MIIRCIDPTYNVNDLSNGSIRLVECICDDCGGIWITQYRNIIGTGGRYCKTCCHSHKKSPMIDEVSYRNKSEKLSIALTGRYFSKIHKTKISISKTKSPLYYWNVLKDHPNISLIDNELFFKCPVCEIQFKINKTQMNELMRYKKTKKYNNVFHSISCRKEYLRRDNFNTLYQNGHDLGKSPWNKGLEMCVDVKNKISNTFNKNIDDHRYNMRQAAIHRLEKMKKSGVIMSYPNRGGYEIECFKELQKLSKYEIKLNKQIIGYFPDGYIEELNLILEFDEPHHYRYNDDGTVKLSDKDKKRQKDLQEYLKCDFLRIRQEKWIADKEYVLDNFRNMINKQ